MGRPQPPVSNHRVVPGCIAAQPFFTGDEAMAYDEALADRIRRSMGADPLFAEEKMFRSLAFPRPRGMISSEDAATLRSVSYTGLQWTQSSLRGKYSGWRYSEPHRSE
jgi:hypothetical protein